MDTGEAIRREAGEVRDVCQYCSLSTAASGLLATSKTTSALSVIWWSALAQRRCLWSIHLSPTRAFHPSRTELCRGQMGREHGAEFGLDGSRIAVAGNSVGGDMSAALTLMAKDRGGPNIRLQVLLIPATDTNFDTQSYRDFNFGRFLARALCSSVGYLRTTRDSEQPVRGPNAR